MQPALSTARLSLRPVTLGDVDTLRTVWTDPLVRKYLWDDREISREEAATTLAAGTLLGCADLLPVSTAAEYDPRLAGLVEPLVALTPRAWGRGYAAEALAGLQRYARSALGLERLAGVTDVPNAASDRMLRRAGCRVLGEVRPSSSRSSSIVNVIGSPCTPIGCPTRGCSRRRAVAFCAHRG